MTYTTPIQDDDGDYMTKADFIDSIRIGVFTDYDGHGRPTNNKMIDESYKIYPSFVGTGIHKEIDAGYSEGDFPDDADGIVWFNK